MKKVLFTLTFLGSAAAFAQNVGINATGAAPVTSAALDVDMANKGILIPRVALTTTAAFAPVTGTATTSLLVYNTATAGVSPTNVTPGYYYWDGAQWVRMATGTTTTDWIVGGNTLGATGIFGSLNNNHVDFYSNNVVRGRLSNLGEFFIGATATVLAGDLMNGVGNATFPWAVNGYTSSNGSGVYGSVQGGTTIFAGVQGEYYGTNVNGAGMRGIAGNTTAGTSFAAMVSGVNGTGAISAATAGSYKMGVWGSGGQSGRSGGVLGNDLIYASGALGYFSSGGADVAVYGFGQAHTNGAAGGIIQNPNGGQQTNQQLKSGEIDWMAQPNTMTGLGIYGGVMGGWVRGLVYGTHLKGERYSLYVDGKTYANEPMTQLVQTEGENRQAVYSTSAMKVEISDRGKSALQNGEKYIAFTQEFKSTISENPDELTITVSPTGNSNGIYILSYDQNGFTVKENNSGASNVTFNWIAIGTRKNYETMEHSPEVIAGDFDGKMNNVMFNENDATRSAQPLWWDGTDIRWDAPPARPENNTTPAFIRPQSSTPLPVPKN